MYAQIAANKRKTWALLIFFSLFVTGLFLLIGLANGLGATESLVFGAVFSFFYSLISYFVSAQATLATAGAKKIEKKDHFELFTLVENLAITAGLPMPEIYVINDPSPNAFATGRDPQHASVAVTTGLLSILNKTELEGVLAHEMSHIKNYDIRVMTIVVVLVGLVVLVADLFLRFNIFGRGSRDSDNRYAFLIYLALAILMAIIAPLIAQVIKFAVSRSREYLADSSGALLTRHPDGLASALEKIRDYGAPMKRANHATAHLFISNPFGAEATKRRKGFFTNLFSTHPPIEERIARLRTIGR